MATDPEIQDLFVNDELSIADIVLEVYGEDEQTSVAAARRRVEHAIRSAVSEAHTDPFSLGCVASGDLREVPSATHSWSGAYGIPGGTERWEHGSYRWRRGVEAVAVLAALLFLAPWTLEVAAGAMVRVG